MTTLVAGASGATGKLLVEQLLAEGHKVKIIVRPSSQLPNEWNTTANLTIIRKAISDIGVEEMAGYVADCDAVASCLGHTLSFKGIYGKPRRLVTNAVKTICEAITRNRPQQPVRFVLMNTAGNRNRDLKEPVSIPHRMVIALLRLLLPPHPDNEKAADHLRVNVVQHNPFIEWVAVRPDSLVNAEKVSPYSLHPSPVSSPIFKPGKTSRINVANFMYRLMTEEEIWKEWRGRMPVVYNGE